MFLLFVREQNFSDEAQQKSNPAGRIALAPVRGAGSRVIQLHTLQFYEPKDTPGCTREHRLTRAGPDTGGSCWL